MSVSLIAEPATRQAEMPDESPFGDWDDEDFEIFEAMMAEEATRTSEAYAERLAEVAASLEADAELHAASESGDEYPW